MPAVEQTAPEAARVTAAGADILDSAEAGSRALRGGIISTGGYGMGILLSLVSVPLVINHLGFSGYGRYLTVVSLIAIVGALTEGGLNAIALREYTATRGAARLQMMRNALGVRLLLTSAGVALAVGFAVLAGYGSELVLGTVLAGVALEFQLVQNLFAVALQGELRFGWVSTAELIRQGVQVTILVVLVLTGAGIAALLAAAIPASAVSMLLTATLARGRASFRPAFATRTWWPLVRGSLPWAAVSALNVVYFRLSLVIMSLAASAVQTGYFATSFRIVEVLIGIPLVTVAAGYPILTRTVRADRDRFAYATERMFELSLVVGTWMVVCLEVGAPFAIHVLAKGNSDPAVTVLRIQGPAVLATFVAVACGFPLLTLRRYRDALLANAIALAMSAALTIVLVGPLGARGAAIAALAAEVALAAIVVVMLRRAAPHVRLRPSAAAIAALAGGAAAAAGIAAPVHPVLGALLASVVYFAVLGLCGRFPPEALELVRTRSRAATP